MVGIIVLCVVDVVVVGCPFVIVSVCGRYPFFSEVME